MGILNKIGFMVLLLLFMFALVKILFNFAAAILALIYASTSAVNFDQSNTNPDINISHEPYADVFRRTFLARNPDGHIIRVSPLDR
jgi:hypothetical protein